MKKLLLKSLLYGFIVGIIAVCLHASLVYRYFDMTEANPFYLILLAIRTLFIILQTIIWLPIYFFGFIWMPENTNLSYLKNILITITICYFFIWLLIFFIKKELFDESRFTPPTEMDPVNDNLIEESEEYPCSSCGKNNEQDANFCDACGTNLRPVLICAHCKAENDIEAKYCDQCARELDTPGFRKRQRRRLIYGLIFLALSFIFLIFLAGYDISKGRYRYSTKDWRFRAKIKKMNRRYPCPTRKKLPNINDYLERKRLIPPKNPT